jgi:outer membrane receptor protein involved in Fe transport
MPNSLSPRGVSVIALSCGLVFPTTVLAQAQQAEGGAAQEIVITGEKIDRSLQETVSSVAVTTDDRLANENIQTLSDIFNRTANVSETYGSTGFTIRGIANQGVSGAGDAPVATIYVDGAAMPDQLVGVGPTDLWDVAQVEIFRGPQSTLQGLNALSGAIVIRTQDPTMDWSGRARVTLAEYDTAHFAAAFGGPLAPGELAFRVAAEKRDSDGFIRNVTRNTDEDPTDALTLRGKLLWTPSALPGFEARLGYTHFKQTSGYDFSYSELTGADPFGDRVALSDAPNITDTNADIGVLDLSYEIGGGFALSSVSSYSDVDLFRGYDGDLTPDSLSYGSGRYRYKTFTQELRLSYQSDWLSGLVGAYYYNRKQQSDSVSLTLVPTPVDTAADLLQAAAGLDRPTAEYVAGLYASALPVIPVQYAGDFPAKVETVALFGDARIALSDRLTVLAGARWDHETNRIQVTQTTQFVGTFPNPADYGALAPLIAGLNAGVQGLVDEAAGATPENARTFDAFLPKLGIEMAWTPDIATSFMVQRGYRSGGASSNLARSAVFAYDPEYTWNYELALRSQWLDGRLTLNANAFYIDWKNQQASVNFGLNLYDYHTVNAGKSHLYGFEVELAHRPSRNIDWYASLGHTRTKFDEFTTNVGAVTDLSGLEFIYAPHWTVAAGVNLRTDSGFTFNLNGSHRSDVFTDVVRPQALNRAAARTIVNAKIGYQAEHFGISVFANNLFDEDYVHYRYPGEARAVLGDPRVFGVILEGRF